MKRAARSATMGSFTGGGGTGSSPRRIRSIISAALRRASSAVMSTDRPIVARFGRPPGVRAWATKILRPVAWTLMPNPGSSRSQNTLSPRSTESASMVLLLSLTAPTAGFSDIVQPTVSLPTPSSIRKRLVVKSMSLTVATRLHLTQSGESGENEKIAVTTIYNTYVPFSITLDIVCRAGRKMVSCFYKIRSLPVRGPRHPRRLLRPPDVRICHDSSISMSSRAPLLITTDR